MLDTRASRPFDVYLRGLNCPNGKYCKHAFWSPPHESTAARRPLLKIRDTNTAVGGCLSPSYGDTLVSTLNTRPTSTPNTGIGKTSQDCVSDRLPKGFRTSNLPHSSSSIATSFFLFPLSTTLLHLCELSLLSTMLTFDFINVHCLARYR